MILLAPFLLVFTSIIHAHLGFLDRRGSPGYIETMTTGPPQAIPSVYNENCGIALIEHLYYNRLDMFMLLCSFPSGR